MDQREDYCELNERAPRKPWAAKRELWKVSLLAVVAALVGLLFVPRVTSKKVETSIQDNKVDISIIRANQLAEACRAFRAKSPTNSYPTRLEEVIPFLDNPDLTDAWGNPFHYALDRNANGDLEPYVWAERVRDGKVTIHGAKRTADGHRVLFGLPED
jgi:hypothetical protein